MVEVRSGTRGDLVERSETVSEYRADFFNRDVRGGNRDGGHGAPRLSVGSVRYPSSPSSSDAMPDAKVAARIVTESQLGTYLERQPEPSSLEFWHLHSDYRGSPGTDAKGATPRCMTSTRRGAQSSSSSAPHWSRKADVEQQIGCPC